MGAQEQVLEIQDTAAWRCGEKGRAAVSSEAMRENVRLIGLWSLWC